MPDLHDAEMLMGAYIQDGYPWHAHEEVSLGLVVEGAIHVRTPFRDGIASAGSFVIVNAQELHDGTAMRREGWRCRTIHLMPEVIRTIAAEIRPSEAPLPIAFRGPIFDDPELARAFLHLHCIAEKPGSLLECQSWIVFLLAQILARCAETRLEASMGSREPTAIRRAREYLDENLSDKVTLDELAEAVGITRFRLLRAFKRTLGLTPHAYQLQARVRAAHGMVWRKVPLAEVAVVTGFSDQAHLTRVYKSIMGATPGQYRAAGLFPR
jgi:AraC-like DNA-binding protein